MTRDDLCAFLTNDNVLAFARVVREGESRQDDAAYTMRFGGLGNPPAYFDDLAAHPRIFELTHGGQKSSAAGAYQATWTTWNEEQQRWGWPDFSKQSQDEFFVARLIYRRAVDAVIAGRFDEACRLCKSEWTSLPGGAEENAATRRARETFLKWGGRIAPATAPEVKRMPAPIAVAAISAFLPEIVKLLPKLGSIFGSGSEVANRNIAAASMVGEALVTATNSPNLQAAVERMQEDPACLQAASAAVDELWPAIGEAGGGGIRGARDFVGGHMDGRAGRILEVVTYATLTFLLIANALALTVFVMKEESGLLNTVIQADIGATLMALGFWLGTSLGSQKKDAALAGRLP